jgi:hypothetical protein
MARGWESKSVESQIESARTRPAKPQVHLTPEQMADERKRDALLLQRTRILHQLDGCKDERYRKTLSDGLFYLEAQLTDLGWKE